MCGPHPCIHDVDINSLAIQRPMRHIAVKGQNLLINAI
jgi:hypothetical protein